MLFKFDGYLPMKLEFTCKCSAWSCVDHLRTDNCSKDKPKIVKCTNCNQIVKVWQKDSHWHMLIEE